MNTSRSRRQRANKRRSLIGFLLGTCMGLGGMGAGIYFGILKPALASGKSLTLPLRAIVTDAAILLLLVTGLTLVLYRWVRSDQARNGINPGDNGSTRQ